MVGSTYAASPQKEDCSIRRASMLCRLRIDGKHLRLAQRGGAEKSDSSTSSIAHVAGSKLQTVCSIVSRKLDVLASEHSLRQLLGADNREVHADLHTDPL